MGKRKGGGKAGRQSAPANPRELQIAFQQAVSYFQNGRLEEADAICRKVLKQVPGLPDMLHFRGLIACRSGDPRKGAKLIREAVTASPGNAEYRVNLGNACRELGRADEAIKHFKAALKIQPNIPELRNGLGILYKDKGDKDAAEKEFLEAVQLRSGFAQAHYNLGVLYLEQERRGAAIKHYKEAIRADARFTDAYIALAQIHKDLSIAEKALPLYEEALRQRPGNHGLMLEYAEVLQEAGRTEEALQIAHQALALAPEDDVPTLVSMGQLLLNAGDHAEAQEFCRKVLAINPDAVGMLCNIANARKFQEGDPEIAEMKQALEREELPDEVRGNLHFSLGKVYNDCKQYDQAFRHYLSGNHIRRQSVEYHRDRQQEYIDRLISFFDHTLFADRTYPGLESDLPIFIVGMPRSGTTLTEQILSSHPQVFGAGELGDMNRILHHLVRLAGKDSEYPDALKNLDAEVLDAVGNRFLDNLRAYDPDVRHVTDKMPHNFMHLGLIAYLLPKARIVHCRRNPLDNCISIFFQNFKGEHAYKWDLGDLGDYYRLYERLMQHWEQVLPNPMFEVRYEEMVANQEELSRRLIEFCGLEWDDACLEFYKSERSVKTASHWQVRQPIYQSSAERWRRYEDHIGPLVEALGLDK
jgi:tetratricopeptide (TPR) repeat protein